MDDSLDSGNWLEEDLWPDGNSGSDRLFDQDESTVKEFYSEGFVTQADEGGELVFRRHGRMDGLAVEMARFSSGVLRIFPRQGSDRGKEAAYPQLKEIRIDLDQVPSVASSDTSGPYFADLPEGLGRSFQFGLMFPKRYRCLVKEIEAMTPCSVLHITGGAGGAASTVAGGVLYVPLTRFKDMVGEIDRNYNRASDILDRVRTVAARNVIFEASGQPTQEPLRGRLPAIQNLTDAIRGVAELDVAEEEELIGMLTDQSAKSVRRHADAIGRLRNDLDLVTLEVLLETFRAALANPKKAKNEKLWQKFFRSNRFVLQQLFGAPVISVSETQLQVRPSDSKGGGARIVDFLLANTLTREGLVVEIKTPATELVSKKPYRGKGDSSVFGPHGNLTGAVAQLQSQKDSLRSRLDDKLTESDPLATLKSASPRGALIVGTVANLEGGRLESFHRYRDGLHDVLLLGFDEVAERLQGLLNLLKETEIDPS